MSTEALAVAPSTSAQSQAAPPPVSLSASSSPTGSSIQSVSTARPSSQPASIIPPQEAPSAAKVVTSARKALGLNESPTKVIQGMTRQLKARVDATDTPLTPKRVGASEVEPPKSAALGQLEEVQSEPSQPSTPSDPKEYAGKAVEPAKASEPEKISIGGKEYSREELEKLIAPQQQVSEDSYEELEGPSAENATQQAAQQQVSGIRDEAALERSFYESAAPKYAPTEDDLDTILAGGKEAVELFGKKLASVELSTRKWVSDSMNPIMEELHQSISPVIQQYREVQAYQREINFKNEFPDLAAHTELVRSVDQAMRAKYPQAARTTPVAEYNRQLAENARRMISTLSPAQQQAQINAASQKPAAAPRSQPKPPTGAIGGTVSPMKVNAQKAMAMDIMNF